MRALAVACAAAALLAPAAFAALSKAQYQHLIDIANARVTRADATAQKALSPSATRAQASAALDAMASAETANARMFASAQAPANVAAVNRAIVHAERLYAAELRAFARRVRTAPTRAAAIRILHGPGPHPGPQLLDRAIAELHRLGYR